MLLFTVRRFYIDGKFRADPTAHTTSRAFIRFRDTDNLIPLCVRFIGLIENVLGTEFNTETTPFASFIYDVNLVLFSSGGHLTLSLHK
jgi:hypothetical protein